MTFDTVLAKTYFARETDNEFDTALTNALVPAKNVFRSKFGIEEFIRFANFTNPITATLKTDDNKFNYDDSVNKFALGDMVEIDSLLFSIIEAGDGYFVIDNDYAGSSLEITNQTMLAYQSVFAWEVLYMMTFTARKLITDIILETSQQFGEGNIIPAYDPVKSYRKELLNNISMEVSALKLNLPPVQFGRS